MLTVSTELGLPVLQFWCKNPPHCYRSKDKIPELWKGLYVNCCDFFYAEDFVGRIGIRRIMPPYYVAQLYSSSISSEIFFFITMPQEARKGKSRGGTLKPASGPCKPVFWVFTACKQMKNRGIKCVFILVVVRPTGRAKLVPYWIPQFHQIFTSSASSKTKTDKEFSCVFFRTWRWTKAKLISNKS